MAPEVTVTLLILALCGAVLWATHTRVHRLRSKIILPPKLVARILELAERSLESSDVPVGALLLFEGSIIGEGCNTVLRNARAGEHAEVNAISSAIAAMGIEKFSLLDRGRLVLVSTFEPCLMCAGAFINYNIQHVYFMKEKDLTYAGREEAQLLRYLLRRKQVRNNDEQAALFRRHPAYAAKNSMVHQQR